MRLVSRPISGLFTQVRFPGPLFLTFAAFALALVAAGVSTAAETDAVRAVARPERVKPCEYIFSIFWFAKPEQASAVIV